MKVTNEQVLKLSKRDAELLVQALDAPPKIHKRLQQAAQRYMTKVKSQATANCVY